MNLQEMLITGTPQNITDEQLEKVAYGLINGEFGLELQPRQRELQLRLREIEMAKQITLRQRVSLPNSCDAYYNDSNDDDEYE